LTSISCQASLSINGESQVISSAVEYRQDSTPQVLGISPKLGTIAGKTEVTIAGTGFGTDKTKVAVVIDGITCVVSSVIDTSIECTTGPR
jgi:hypothetical protein